MKQTAVEWLGKELESYGDPQFCEIEWEQLDSLIQQAKEMEKEQIVDFGYDIADDLACGKYRDKKAMEERYNEFLTYREEDDDI
jgi:hypothetical protein